MRKNYKVGEKQFIFLNKAIEESLEDSKVEFIYDDDTQVIIYTIDSYKEDKGRLSVKEVLTKINAFYGSSFISKIKAKKGDDYISNRALVSFFLYRYTEISLCSIKVILEVGNRQTVFDDITRLEAQIVEDENLYNEVFDLITFIEQ